MSEPRAPVREPSTDQVLESVAEEVRREALVVLEDRSEPVSVRELATAVAALRTGTPYDAVGNAARKPVAVALVHVHLPKLSAADLVDWAPGEDVVATPDRAALDDRRLRELLSVEADDWDAVLRALADARRRAALAILQRADDGCRRGTLARRLAATELDVEPSDAPDDAVEDVRTELHHAHLPKLRMADLVSVDGEAVQYEGHTELDSGWLTRVTGVVGVRDRAVSDAASAGPGDGDGPGARGRRPPLDGAQD